MTAATIEKTLLTRKDWEVVKLGDVCEILTGGTPNTNYAEYWDGNINWLASGDIHQGEILESSRTITEKGLLNSNAKLLPLNSILIALNGQGKTRGTVGILRVPATCNQSLAAISPKLKYIESIKNEFILLNLKFRYQEIRNLTGDDQRSGLNLKILANIKIPLPPLTIQKEIADYLQFRLTCVEEAKQAVKAELEAVKSLKQAYLREVFSSEQSKVWGKVKLGEVLTFIGSGVTPLGGHSVYTDSGILFIRSQNVLWGKSDFSDAVFVSEETHKNMQRSVVKKGDVLLNITGASIGRCTLYNEDYEANVNQHVTILRTRPIEMVPIFLMYTVISPLVQDQILTMQAGGTRQALNYEQIKNIIIPLPPLAVQKEIADYLQTKFTTVETLVLALTEKKKAIDDLPQAFLREVFSIADDAG